MPQKMVRQTPIYYFAVSPGKEGRFTLVSIQAHIYSFTAANYGLSFNSKTLHFTWRYIDICQSMPIAIRQ